MKKLFSLLLALCMVLTLLPFGAMAADDEEWPFGEGVLSLNGMCGDNLNWTLTKEGVLTITGFGEMTDDYFWGVRYDLIKKVILPDGLTKIGADAFGGCRNVTEISIPDSVTTIGTAAFSGSGLTSLTIPDSVTSIGQRVLSGCTLTDLKLSGGLTEPNNPFGGCSIENLDLGMCTLHLYDLVYSYGSNNLKNLKTIRVDPENPAFTVVDNTLYSKDGKTLIYRPAALTEAFAVPANVTAIDRFAFSYSQAPEIDLLGSGVTSIAYGAFWGASNLKRIELPNTVNSLEESTMRSCASLETVVLPDGLKALPAATFLMDSALKTVYLPGSLDTVGNQWRNKLSADTVVYYGGSETQLQALQYEKEPDKDYFEACTVNFNHKHTRDEGAVTPDGSKVFHCKDCTKTYLTSFDDVAPGDYFEQPVAWAVKNNITQGTGAGAFSPDMTCTRGQVVTFLWRAAGEPEPTSSVNPFTDVAPSDYFYKAVLWAVEKNITQGTGNGLFSPDGECTRAQVVTFLHRANSSPAPQSADNPFGDVTADAYYFNAVLWAVENGITSGTGAGAFSPDMTCSRGQIVTFLYRDRT